jgi:hypothetical protein
VTSSIDVRFEPKRLRCCACRPHGLEKWSAEKPVFSRQVRSRPSETTPDVDMLGDDLPSEKTKRSSLFHGAQH